MRKIYLISLLFALSQNAFADWHYDKVKGVMLDTDGGLSIIVKTVHECGSQVMAVSNPKSEYIDRIISALLFNQEHDRRASFVIQSCSGDVAIIDRIRTY